MSQSDLFPNEPRDLARLCGVCGAILKSDYRGILRHKPGEGKRCDDLLRSRRTKPTAHFSTETGATLKPKP